MVRVRVPKCFRHTVQCAGMRCDQFVLPMYIGALGVYWIEGEEHNFNFQKSLWFALVTVCVPISRIGETGVPLHIDTCVALFRYVRTASADLECRLRRLLPFHAGGEGLCRCLHIIVHGDLDVFSVLLRACPLRGKRRIGR